MRSKFLITTLLLSIFLAACAPATPAPQPLPTETAEPTLIPTLTPTAAPTEAPTAAPLTFTDMRGKTFEFAAPVQKIVSLAPSNTEILFAIGAGKQVVGRDSFSDYPAAAQAVPDIGGGFGALNTEIILAAKPDLVLAGDLTPAEQIQSLEDLGLIVFVLGNPKNLAGMYENLRLMAHMTGHVDETETLVASLQAREKAVDAQLAGVTERPLVLYELDGTDPNAPWIPGPGTFIDTLIKQAGGENLGASLEGAWVQVSLEVLIQKDPDLILLGDSQWGGVTPEMVAARGGWEALTAVKAGKIYPFDDNTVSRPGPRLLDGLEALAKVLHPELYK
jgi:iron complex transport system substrate-binding protein